jgi:hypothetical protein
MIDKFSRAIQKRQNEIKQIRHLRELDKKKNRPVKKAIRTGRPRIDENLIKKAKNLGKDHYLPDVALSLGLSLRTLYNYGITRENLNREAEKANTIAPPAE